MGSHSVHSMNVPVICLCLASWWLNEPKHVAEFLYWLPIYVVFIDWTNYYIIAKRNGKAHIKVRFRPVGI